MKALNNMKFITEATTQFGIWLSRIEAAESYERAKQEAYGAMGYLDCMTVYLNAMIDKENNDFTGELSVVLDEWHASVYQKLVDKAVETKQEHDVVWRLLEKRDEYLS